jgi:hypothetical protein
VDRRILFGLTLASIVFAKIVSDQIGHLTGTFDQVGIIHGPRITLRSFILVSITLLGMFVAPISKKSLVIQKGVVNRFFPNSQVNQRVGIELVDLRTRLEQRQKNNQRRVAEIRARTRMPANSRGYHSEDDHSNRHSNDFGSDQEFRVFLTKTNPRQYNVFEP